MGGSAFGCSPLFVVMYSLNDPYHGLTFSIESPTQKLLHGDEASMWITFDAMTMSGDDFIVKYHWYTLNDYHKMRFDYDGEILHLVQRNGWGVGVKRSANYQKQQDERKEKS